MSTQLNRKQALAICHYVGFRGERLVTAVAVMGAESGRIYDAVGTNPDGSHDRGLFQINDAHDQYISPEAALLPLPNAAFAYRLSKEGRDFSPWAAYNSGAYLDNVEAIRSELDAEKAGEWKTSIAEREKHFERAGQNWVPGG